MTPYASDAAETDNSVPPLSPPHSLSLSLPLSLSLSLSVDLDALLPPDAVYMSRTDLHETRLLGFTPVNLEVVTGVGVGLFGSRPAIRHQACSTDELLELIALSGLDIREATLRFGSAEEAHTIAGNLVKRGHRLLSAYPMPPNLYRDADLLVANSLWRQLNSKHNLDRLVAPEHLPSRQVMDSLAAREIAYTRPVWLKIANDEASGWGYAVRFCDSRLAYQKALDELNSLAPGAKVLVEEHIPVKRSWCAGFVVSDDRVAFLGAAEQLFGSPGKQSGSFMDSNVPPVKALEEVVISLAARAQSAGFRGIGGCDVGETDDGELFVFDPNFRINASTTQVLLHASATRRGTGKATSALTLRSHLAFSEMIRRVRDDVKAGRFVATRGLDARHLAAADGVSSIIGFVIGDSLAATEEAACTLTARMQADDQRS